MSIETTETTSESSARLIRVCYGALQAQIMPRRPPTHMEDIALGAIPKNLWAQRAPDKDALVSLVLWPVFQRWAQETKAKEVILEHVDRDERGRARSASMLVSYEVGQERRVRHVRLARDRAYLIPIFESLAGHKLTALVSREELGEQVHDLPSIEIDSVDERILKGISTELVREYLCDNVGTHSMTHIADPRTPYFNPSLPESPSRIHIFVARYTGEDRASQRDAWHTLSEKHKGHMVVCVETAYKFVSSPLAHQALYLFEKTVLHNA